MKREVLASNGGIRGREDENNEIMPSDPPVLGQSISGAQDSHDQEGIDGIQATVSDIVETPASTYASEKSSHRKRLCEFKDCSPSKAPRILRQLLDDRMELYIKYQMYKRELELMTDE